jgi:hypothetical protein
MDFKHTPDFSLRSGERHPESDEENVYSEDDSGENGQLPRKRKRPMSVS